MISLESWLTLFAILTVPTFAMYYLDDSGEVKVVCVFSFFVFAIPLAASIADIAHTLDESIVKSTEKCVQNPPFWWGEEPTFHCIKSSFKGHMLAAWFFCFTGICVFDSLVARELRKLQVQLQTYFRREFEG